jgi:hypothetical protein
LDDDRRGDADDLHGANDLDGRTLPHDDALVRRATRARDGNERKTGNEQTRNN